LGILQYLQQSLENGSCKLASREDVKSFFLCIQYP
jgi:hypothetical protein